MVLEDCVKRIGYKQINGKTWLIVDKECSNCAYAGKVMIYYCRSKLVYSEAMRDDKQLILPYKP
jgi:hypothetical protein